MKTIQITIEDLKSFARQRPNKKFELTSCVDCLACQYIKSIGYTNPKFSSIDRNFTAFMGNDMYTFEVPESFNEYCCNSYYESGEVIAKALESLS